MAQQSKTHHLYHEAKRRASLPQPSIKHMINKSLILISPNNIIFELFNTIVKEIHSDNLLDFITKNLTDYLDSNWTNKTTQRAITRLRREQAIDIKAGLANIPIIGRLQSRIRAASPPISRSGAGQVEDKDQKLASRSNTSSGRLGSLIAPSSLIKKSPPLDYEPDANRQAGISQVYEHIMWRIKSDNVTQITSLLIKLVLDDGYKRGKLKADLYADVAACFEDWRSNKLIKLYAFGNAPANDQKLILSSTTSGDITKWVANYIDGSEKRQQSDLLRKLASALRDKTKNCIFITNDIDDALKSLQSGAIRCAFVVDRLRLYEPIESIEDFSTAIEPNISSGKLYIMSSLNCVEFVQDPSSETCC